MKQEHDVSQIPEIKGANVIILQSVSLNNSVPMINAILPVSNIEQVIARSSNDKFNKGIEAALATAEYISWRRATI